MRDRFYGVESLKDCLYSADVDWHHAVSDIRSCFVVLVDPVRLASDDRPLLAFAPELLKTFPHLAFRTSSSARSRRKVLTCYTLNRIPEC